MKTGSRVIRYSKFGVVLEEGSIQPVRSRKKAREVVRWYAQLGKKARVIRDVWSRAVVTR
jgi:hypothetical protein